MAKTYKSEVMATLHESMADLHEIGAIDNRTMRIFDKSCLTPINSASALPSPATPACVRCPSGSR